MKIFALVLLLVVGAVASACQDDVSAPELEDADSGVQQDVPGSEEVDSDRVDISSDGGSDSAADLSDVDPALDLPDEPPDPCAEIDCGEHGFCVAGVCECDEGYQGNNGACQATDPEDPALRSVELVCSRYAAEVPSRATTVWHSQGEGECDPGLIDDAAHTDAMRRLNYYRWLVGVESSSSDAENQRVAQLAAMMMDVNGRLDHNPPPEWDCYDAEGARAAGMSNLARGYRTPADTLIGYINDGGTPSLGHRRWAFFPNLDRVGFGHRGQGGAMFVFASTQREPPEFVAYPPPGPVPSEAVHGVWSFSQQGVGDPQVRVVEVSTDRELPVVSRALQRGYGLDTISIEVQERVQTGATYRVHVGETVYETTLVACP